MKNKFIVTVATGMLVIHPLASLSAHPAQGKQQVVAKDIVISRGLVYKNGKPLSGVHSGVRYRQGAPFNGISSSNGLMYKNGLKVSGEIGGVRYKKGKPFTGVSSKTGARYKNGLLVDIKEIVELEKKTKTMTKAIAKIGAPTNGKMTSAVNKNFAKKALIEVEAQLALINQALKKATTLKEITKIKEALAGVSKALEKIKKTGVSTTKLSEKVTKYTKNMTKKQKDIQKKLDEEKPVPPKETPPPQEEEQPQPPTEEKPVDPVEPSKPNPEEEPSPPETTPPVESPSGSTPSTGGGGGASTGNAVTLAQTAVSDASKAIGDDLDVDVELTALTPQIVIDAANAKIPTNVPAKVTNAVPQQNVSRLKTTSMIYELTITSTNVSTVTATKNVTIHQAINPVQIAFKLLDGKEITVPYQRSDSSEEVLKALYALGKGNALIEALTWEDINIHRTETDDMAVTVKFAEGVEATVSIKEATPSSEAKVLASSGYTVDGDNILVDEDANITGNDILISERASHDILNAKEEWKANEEILEDGDIIVVNAEDRETSKRYTVVVPKEKTVERVLQEIDKALTQSGQTGKVHPAIALIIEHATLLDIDLTAPFTLNDEEFSFEDVSLRESISAEEIDATSLTTLQNTFKQAVVDEIYNEENLLREIEFAKNDGYSISEVIFDLMFYFNLSTVDYDVWQMLKTDDDELQMPLDGDYSTAKKAIALFNQTVAEALTQFDAKEVADMRLLETIKALSLDGYDGTNIHPQLQVIVEHAETLGIELTHFNQLAHPEKLASIYGESFEEIANAFQMSVSEQLSKEGNASAFIDSLYANLASFKRVSNDKKLSEFLSYQTMMTSFYGQLSNEQKAEEGVQLQDCWFQFVLSYMQALGLEGYVTDQHLPMPNDVTAVNIEQAKAYKQFLTNAWFKGDWMVAQVEKRLDGNMTFDEYVQQFETAIANAQ